MAGIVRIKIEDGKPKDWRFKMSIDLAPIADTVYREAFGSIGLTLLPKTEYIVCTMQEATSRYDWQEGIDVLLYFSLGGKATLQEKFLSFPRSTISFEECKASGLPGAWYYCTAQYYFVGYARKYKHEKILKFQDWMLIDLPGLKRLDARNKVEWGDARERTPANPCGLRKNTKDRRKSTFRFAYFENIPLECTIACMSKHAKTPTKIHQAGLGI